MKQRMEERKEDEKRREKGKNSKQEKEEKKNYFYKTMPGTVPFRKVTDKIIFS